MYHEHFGLSGAPFQFYPGDGPIYLGTAHREALAALEWGMAEPTGFILLTGDVGTGKTTIVHALLARRHEGVRAIYLANPRLSFEEILRVISQRLGLSPAGDGRLAMIQALDRMLEEMPDGTRMVLIFDEAQELSEQALEELRLLSNSEGAGKKPLQMILVGQHELVQRLAAPNLRQLDQRIGVRAVLAPMRREEARAYIDWRLRARGGQARLLFTPRALRLIVRRGGGIARRLNMLCHNAMVLGFAAGAERIEVAMVRAAVRDLRAPGKPPRRSRVFRRRLLLGGALAGLGLALTWWLVNNPGVLRELPRSGLRVLTGGGEVESTTAAKRAVQALPAVAPPPRREGPPPEDASPPSPPPAGMMAGMAAAPLESPQSRPTAAQPLPEGVKRPHARRQVVIRAGDTVDGLALRYLGSDAPQTLALVAQDNPDLPNINRIFPGERVTLPDTDEVARIR